MKKYLIRFNQEAIIACLQVSVGAQISGFSENTMIMDLETAMTMLSRAGYDISPLVDEYNKPEEMLED